MREEERNAGGLKWWDGRESKRNCYEETRSKGNGVQEHCGGVPWGGWLGYRGGSNALGCTGVRSYQRDWQSSQTWKTCWHVGFIDWELARVGEVFVHPTMAWKNPLPASWTKINLRKLKHVSAVWESFLFASCSAVMTPDFYHCLKGFSSKMNPTGGSQRYIRVSPLNMCADGIAILAFELWPSGQKGLSARTSSRSNVLPSLLLGFPCPVSLFSVQRGDAISSVKRDQHPRQATDFGTGWEVLCLSGFFSVGGTVLPCSSSSSSSGFF